MTTDHYELAKICEEAYVSATFLAKGDVEVLLKDYPDYTVIAIRGTEACDLWTQRDGFHWRDVFKRKLWVGWWGAVQDIRRDLMAWPTYSRILGAHLHTGFLGGAVSVSEYILTRCPLDKPVVVTGHSLGGGIALILALLLRHARVNVMECVLFGAPKIISKKSKAVCAGLNLTSYRHGNDFVTTVPRYLWGYVHPAPLLQLGSRAGRPSWDDHAIGNYVDALTPYPITEEQ